jgi:hypothetical protein
VIAEPTPERIARARKAAGDSSTVAAARVRVTRSAWLHWEAGRRPMPWAPWELYLALTGQHPELKPRE